MKRKDFRTFCATEGYDPTYFLKDHSCCPTENRQNGRVQAVISIKKLCSNPNEKWWWLGSGWKHGAGEKWSDSGCTVKIRYFV